MRKDVPLERPAEEGRNTKCRGRPGRLRFRRSRETCDDTSSVLSPPLSPQMYSPLSSQDQDAGSIDNSEGLYHCSPRCNGGEVFDKPTDDGRNAKARGGGRQQRRRRPRERVAEEVTPSETPTFPPKPHGADSVYEVHSSTRQKEPQDAKLSDCREDPEDAVSDFLDATKMAAFFLMGVVAFAFSVILLVIWFTAAYCFVVDKDFTETAVGAYMFRNSPYWENAIRRLFGGLICATVDLYRDILAFFQGICGRLGTSIYGGCLGFLESVLGFTFNNSDFERQQTESLMRMHQLRQQQYMVVLSFAGAAAICLIEAALISVYRRQLVNLGGPRPLGIFVDMHQRIFHILGLEAAASSTVAAAETTPLTNPVEANPAVQRSAVPVASDDAAPVNEGVKLEKDGIVAASGPPSAEAVKRVSGAGLLLDLGMGLAMHAKRLSFGTLLSSDDQRKEAGAVREPLEHTDPAKATTAAAATSVDSEEKLPESRDSLLQMPNRELSVHPGELPASVKPPLSRCHRKTVHEDLAESVSESDWCILTSSETCAPPQ